MVKSGKLEAIINLLDTNVVVLKLFPGIQENVIAAILGIDGLKAVVLETYGSGNAPRKEWFIRRLRNALRARDSHRQRHPVQCRNRRDGTL